MTETFIKSKVDFSSFFTEVFDHQRQEVFGDQIPEKVTENFTLVLSQDQEILAAAACQQLYETLKIHDLAVRPNLQKSGLGTRMLDHLKAYAREHGIHTIILTTRSYQAKDFYLKNGFSQYGYLDDMPLKGIGTYYMVYRLSQDET